jgi:Zn-dependent protease
MGNIAVTVSVWVLPVLLAITFHEAAHGWVAWRLGDPTAKQQDRVTFNPMAHIDPIGTVLLPAMLILSKAGFIFGWAKPVPVDTRYLRNPRRDMMLIAAAGPGANVIIAYASLLLMHVAPILPDTMAEWAGRTLWNSVILNSVLAVFNMIPLPPLDGGKVAVGLLPYRFARPLAELERYGFLIILGAFIVLPMLGDNIGIDLHVVQWIIRTPLELLIEVLVFASGHG